MVKRERIFLTELGRTFKEMGLFWYKIPDMPAFKNQNTRFTPAKPFDAIIVQNGLAIAIEAKALPDYQSFGIRHLTRSQHGGLLNFQASGGKAFIFLNIRRAKDKKNGVTALNRLLVFDWTDLRGMNESFSKSDLMAMEFCEGSKGKFELDKLKMLMF